MALFCTECGAPLAEGTAFCTECGTKVAEGKIEPGTGMTEILPVQPVPEAVPEELSVRAVQLVQHPVQQSVQHHPVQPVPEEPPKGKYGAMGTGAYFGLMFLFWIPIIGWLTCLICACVARNRNLRSYAKAKVIWFLIKIILAVAVIFLFRWLGKMLMDTISGMFGTELDELLGFLK